jgi:pyrroline-5-carboxylate reductase
MNLSGPVWLIGCGNMGGAMLKGWIGAGMDPCQITVIDPAMPSLPDGVRTLQSVPLGEAPPVLVLLAIKPQMLGSVAALLRPALGTETMVLSILAGIEIRSLRAAVPVPRRIARIMPNTPASIGRGVSVAHLPGGDVDDLATIDALLSPLGAVEWVDDEALFHAVTALSGSGPAFVFRFIDALANAGAALGLAPDQALRLAIGTVEGSAALAAASDEGPTALAVRVASPNGTTAAGLAQLDADGVFNERVAATLNAAAARSRVLAAGAVK